MIADRLQVGEVVSTIPSKLPQLYHLVLCPSTVGCPNKEGSQAR